MRLGTYSMYTFKQTKRHNKRTTYFEFYNRILLNDNILILHIIILTYLCSFSRRIFSILLFFLCSQSPWYLLLAYKREKTLRQRLPQKVIADKLQHGAQPSTIHIQK